MGGSSPNSDYSFFCKFQVFFVVFFMLNMFPKKKLDRGVGGWGLVTPSFYRIFRFFSHHNYMRSTTTSQHTILIIVIVNPFLNRHCYKF